MAGFCNKHSKVTLFNSMVPAAPREIEVLQIPEDYLQEGINHYGFVQGHLFVEEEQMPLTDTAEISPTFAPIIILR